MNLDSLISSSTIRSETLSATLNRHNYPSVHQTMPQRSPFAIQELLGLSDSSRQPSNGNNVGHQNGVSSGSAVSSVAPSIYSQTNPVDHHQMQMASRMAYFNAHAAAFNVAAAFLPHNMSASGAGPLGLHPQSAGKLEKFNCWNLTAIKVPWSLSILPLQTWASISSLECLWSVHFHLYSFCLFSTIQKQMLCWKQGLSSEYFFSKKSIKKHPIHDFTRFPFIIH